MGKAQLGEGEGVTKNNEGPMWGGSEVDPGSGTDLPQKGPDHALSSAAFFLRIYWAIIFGTRRI